MLFTVGLVIAAGLLLWLLNRAFYKLCGSKARKICIFTGAIGTPIHEIGHAFFCLIFGHKILEIKLFQPNSTDGTLGFVRHSFNKRNVYHQIGRFFIGTGPILLGSAVMIGLSFLFAREMTRDMFGTVNLLQSIDASNFFSALWQTMGAIFLLFFSLSSIANPWWWIFIILALFITLHMSLSPADIKGGLWGLLAIAIIMFIVNLTVGLISLNALESMTNGILSVSLYIIYFLIIGVFFAVILVLIAGVSRGIAEIVKKARAGRSSSNKQKTAERKPTDN